MEAKRKKQAEKELLVPKYLLGSDCETLICGSCKALVGEFAELVITHAKDPTFPYIDDLTAGFCKSRGVTLAHVDMVGDLCLNFELERLGYKETLIAAFERGNEEWDKVTTIPSGRIYAIRKKV